MMILLKRLFYKLFYQNQISNHFKIISNQKQKNTKTGSMSFKQFLESAKRKFYDFFDNPFTIPCLIGSLIGGIVGGLDGGLTGALVGVLVGGLIGLLIASVIAAYYLVKFVIYVYENHKQILARINATINNVSKAFARGFIGLLRLFINKNRQVNHNQNDSKDMVNVSKAFARGFIGLLRLFINKNRQVNHNQNDSKDMVKYVKKDQNILLDGWGIIKITDRERSTIEDLIFSQFDAKFDKYKCPKTGKVTKCPIQLRCCEKICQKDQFIKWLNLQERTTCYLDNSHSLIDQRQPYFLNNGVVISRKEQIEQFRKQIHINFQYLREELKIWFRPQVNNAFGQNYCQNFKL